MDGYNNYATMHIVTKANNHHIKEKIRENLYEYGICHVTLEIEKENEPCHEETCRVAVKHLSHHHH